ncbi:hypothetical protein CYMTET_18466 [Cymbomonas tetramitiformis]|uniref:Uncharacterized protein n=1 Tax=Cymbomonas tetramitiformis TaxID=36881 RepID=A0AAE0G8G1_9CHLO|nr:hypothetical protein CYMTET_18466 [Cymbomonas tetramitiformis]
MSLDSELVRELLAGGGAGAGGIVVGHPLDTLKVRLQTQRGLYSGAMSCFTQIVTKEGPLSLYRGVSAPVLTATATNALMFGGYGAGLRLQGLSRDDQTSIFAAFIAGCTGGFLQCLTVTPVELVKCRLQVDRSSGRQLYQGPLDCAKKILQEHGVRGLFRGWWATVWRDTPSSGLYFVSYEIVKEQLSKFSGKCEALEMLTAGGFAGIAKFMANPSMAHFYLAAPAAGTLSWATAYPIDVVKSRVQTLPSATDLKHLRLHTVVRVNCTDFHSQVKLAVLCGDTVADAI